jgi:TRAP transporter TAXI family solute receptor
MKAKCLFCIIIIFGILVFTPGYSNSQPKQEAKPVAQELKFFSGSPAAGGVWYLISVGITQIFQRSIPGITTHLVPGGAGGGPIVVGGGKADAGLANLGPLLDAQEGLPPFTKTYDNLRVLGNLYDHVFQIIVLKDSGINKISGLKGKVISPGVKGQYTEFWFKKLIKVYNMDPEKDIKIVSLGFGDTAEQMKDKRVDCLATAGPLMMSAMEELATSRDIKYLNIDDAELKKFCATTNGFRPGVVPGDKLVQARKYPNLVTALQPLLVMVRADLPEELVYKMTKALVENLKDLEQLTPPMRGFETKSIARDISPKARFHPGAERYYKERGWR